jgi:hypothetical protein
LVTCVTLVAMLATNGAAPAMTGDAAACAAGTATSAPKSCCHTARPHGGSNRESAAPLKSDSGCPAECFAICCHVSALPDIERFTVQLQEQASVFVLDFDLPTTVADDLALPPPRV